MSGCEFKIYRHQTRIEPSIRTELYLFIAPKEVEFDAAAQGEKIAPETAPHRKQTDQVEYRIQDGT